MDPIIVTDSAVKKFEQMLQANSREAIRFGIKSGGCSGFSYYLEFDELSNLGNNDELINKGNVKLIVDGVSLLYIFGTTIDWVEDIMGSHFSFNSPQQASSCGCGHSVSFKA